MSMKALAQKLYEMGWYVDDVDNELVQMILSDGTPIDNSNHVELHLARHLKTQLHERRLKRMKPFNKI